ncbi:MFS transporter [Rhizobium sp. CSW-27]|uniref:MFS transporter n=1 Tax=Rhizobium sp. CSW-27 TaxID=2839985 RepID=UPI001C03655A|nr:MFS transporter [Rhizobium sp. CSW-27]MBT9370846.1 MFS transporter [Rhizobium sp. CSW-27]
MLTRHTNRAALAALVICHCAGMLDMVALPVWIGVLVERYGFSSQQAGGLVTLFMVGAFLASLVLAPRFNNLNQRWIATAGFGMGSCAFLAAGTQETFPVLAILHLIAGLGAGVALSMAHGTMGRTANPHKMFAISFGALGFLAIILLAALPQLIIAFGASVLFLVFGGIMLVATCAAALLFRNPPRVDEQLKKPFNRATWLTIFGIGIMTFNQSMVFAFVEVIGKTRGFEAGAVLTVLIALGLINFLVPAPLSTFLQSRVSAPLMTQIGPVIQAVLALGVTTATVMPIWGPSAAFFVTTQIFTHTFVFGLLSRLDPTGRATAATPAMALIGAALGPFAGGVLAQNFGFEALGLAAVFVGLTSAACFTLARASARSLQPAPAL